MRSISLHDQGVINRLYCIKSGKPYHTFKQPNQGVFNRRDKLRRHAFDVAMLTEYLSNRDIETVLAIGVPLVYQTWQYDGQRWHKDQTLNISNQEILRLVLLAIHQEHCTK